MLYVLVCQSMPFSIDTSSEGEDGMPVSEAQATQTMQNNIQMGRYSLEPCDRLGLSPELRDLIESLLCVDPEQRLTAADALAHPWFAKFDVSQQRSNQLRVF